MILVADSSALIAISSCNSLTLLDKIFGEVKVPLEVYQEIISGNKFQSETLDKYLSGKILEVKKENLIILDNTLDQGEISAMILYKKLFDKK
ncbi:MAG: hypothetical protein SFU98_16880 [Leptospiraceae bacterium]|nr:hypothetical protein [Leptospiraceae bacterium]